MTDAERAREWIQNWLGCASVTPAIATVREHDLAEQFRQARLEEHRYECSLPKHMCRRCVELERQQEGK